MVIKYWYKPKGGTYMEKLKVLLNAVFDEDGAIRPCGRETCKKLISVASEKYPNVDFGSADTGIMNIEAMDKLRKELL